MKLTTTPKLAAVALTACALFLSAAYAATSGDLVSNMYGTVVGETSTGSVTVVNGEDYAPASDIFLGNYYGSPAGNAGYGTFDMSGGTASLSGLHIGGGAKGVGVLTLSGGTLTITSAVHTSYDGDSSAHIEMTGGTMIAKVGFYLGGRSTGTSTMNLLGGTLQSDYSLQIGTGSSVTHMTISGKAAVDVGGIWLGAYSTLTFLLDGGDGDFNRAIIDTTTGIGDGSYWASNGAQGEIDLSKYSATAEQTITLIHADSIRSGSEDIINWVITGLDEDKYSVGQGVYWDGNDLVITISAVPEPSFAAGLLGLGALVLVARRKK